jgi:hypothetical protein
MLEYIQASLAQSLHRHYETGLAENLSFLACALRLLPLFQPPHPTVAVAQGDGESERRLTIIPLCGMGDVTLLSMSCRLSSLFFYSTSCL